MAGATNGVMLPGGPLGYMGEAAFRGGAVSGLGKREAFGLGNLRYAGHNNFNQNYAGQYKIEGHAREQSTLAPLYRQIFLTPENAPSLMIASTYSDPITGAFSFPGIRAGTYIVQGMDMSGVEDDVVHALITAVPM